MRFFNTAGPVNPDDHYCLDPLKRLDLDELLLLIAQKKYFVLHAPRQTGKTSTLLALMKYLNTAGKHRCLYVNVECAQAARNDVDAGMWAIIWEMASSARDYTGDDSLLPLAKEVGDTHLNQLTDKLREKRVQRVLLPLVTGQDSPDEIPEDDLMYARDLGLLATGNTIAIANPIYREIIPRQLTWTTQQTMVQETAWEVEVLKKAKCMAAKESWNSIILDPKRSARKITPNRHQGKASPPAANSRRNVIALLMEGDHSPRFWNILRVQVPKMDKARAWLREHGQALKQEM